MSKQILLVEDEAGLILTLTDLLAAQGYQVCSCRDGEAALRCAERNRFDLILLDVMLPGRNGFQVCHRLRAAGDPTPILMLTARGAVEDRVHGLKIGADDYLGKPFETAELLARVEALLRRSGPPAAPPKALPFCFGPAQVDLDATQVKRNGIPVPITAREFELLRYFILHAEVTLSRHRLLREVWGYQASMVTRTVDVHVGTLRQKLEEHPKSPQHFLTVRGFGYRFVPWAPPNPGKSLHNLYRQSRSDLISTSDGGSEPELLGTLEAPFGKGRSGHSPR